MHGSVSDSVHAAVSGEILEIRKAEARAWFESLQDSLVAAFEALEDEASALTVSGSVPLVPLRERTGTGG